MIEPIRFILRPVLGQISAAEAKVVMLVLCFLAAAGLYLLGCLLAPRLRALEKKMGASFWFAGAAFAGFGVLFAWASFTAAMR